MKWIKDWDMEDLMTLGLVMKHIKYFFVGCFILLAVCLSCGCTTRQVYHCGEIIKQMNSLWCEDASLVGFTAAHLGHDKWKELTDSYNYARENSKYGYNCKPWNGRWYGTRIQSETAEEYYEKNIRVHINPDSQVYPFIEWNKLSPELQEAITTMSIMEEDMTKR